MKIVLNLSLEDTQIIYSILHEHTKPLKSYGYSYSFDRMEAHKRLSDVIEKLLPPKPRRKSSKT